MIQLPVQAGTPTAARPGPHPHSILRSPRRETPHPFWATCSNLITKGKLFSPMEEEVYFHFAETSYGRQILGTFLKGQF